METPFVRATPARDPLIGRVLHDRYRVQKRIGKGGMGIVYLAEHVLLRRKVALKTITDRAGASDEQVARFHREAMAAAAVGNDHIVDVTDMGQLEDGSYFIVLEYLDGVELAFALAADGPLPLGRAVHIVGQLCDALTAVHAAGIVHRDLKPENLFLVERHGRPDFLKVLDFGVCKIFEDRLAASRPLTHTGASLGTPQFMAPEQVEGDATDTRTDIHAVGAILYFALTGEGPYQGATLPQLFMNICSEPAPSLHARRRDLPPALDDVIARALQKRPEDRYQSCAELRAALEPFVMTGSESRASRASVESTAVLVHSVLARPSWRPRRARTYGVALACVVLAVLAALSSGAWRSSGAAGPSSRDAARARPRSAALATPLGASATRLAPVRPSLVQPAADPMPAGAPNEQLRGATERTATDSAAAIEQPGARTTRMRRGHVSEPAVPVTVEPAKGEIVGDPPPAASTVDPPHAEPAPATPKNAYRLSQRGLKDVF